MVSQQMMERAARAQAEDRANREGAPMGVYKQRSPHPSTGEVRWYVRSKGEGAPEGADLQWVVNPGKAQP